jgi:hypothetical protein
MSATRLTEAAVREYADRIGLFDDVNWDDEDDALDVAQAVALRFGVHITTALRTCRRLAKKAA